MKSGSGSKNRGQGPNSVFYLPFHRCFFFHGRICFVSSDSSEWVRERILYFPFPLPLFLPNSPKPPVRGSSPVDFAARSPPPRLTLRLIRNGDEGSSRSMWGGWPVKGRHCEVRGRQENAGRRMGFLCPHYFVLLSLIDAGRAGKKIWGKKMIQRSAHRGRCPFCHLDSIRVAR
jgi:hypothetical protein